MAENTRIPEVTLEDCRIVFRNFEGRETMYNRAGDRNFSVLLSEDEATMMEKDGWNVKYMKPREEGDTPQAHIEVAVSYKGRPPEIYMIGEQTRKRTSLTEDTVEMLDFVDVANVDLILNPYEWVVNGKTGVKAYLKKMFITIREDPLELKYAALEDAALSRSGAIDD
jgi:hypothetical protein